jgi:hypothetical protein
MELLLNLAWIAVAGCACAFWLRCPAAARDRRARLYQVTALVVLLAVLFPVISLTDDLQAAAFPAETEGAARRMLQSVHVPVSLATTAVRIAASVLLAQPTTSAFLQTNAESAAPVHLVPWLKAAAIRPPPSV